MLFAITLGQSRVRQARTATLLVALASIVVCLFCLNSKAVLFDGAYRVDLFSQFLKLVFACGFTLIVLLSGKLVDIREDVKPEYFLFLTISVAGLTMLVSSVDLITLVVALEVSAYPLYLMIPMRRERPDHRSQMECVVKYMMFGITANGLMYFGMSYLFGLTGTTSLPLLLPKLAPLMHTPLAIGRPGPDALRILLQAGRLPLPVLDARRLPGRFQRDRGHDRLAAQDRARWPCSSVSSPWPHRTTTPSP